MIKAIFYLMNSINQFKININDEEIDDLKKQLSISYKRLFGDNKNEGVVKEFNEGYRGQWSYGTDRKFLKDLVEYWVNEYNWKQHERKLNVFSHFKMPISMWNKDKPLKTHNIHFIHEQSKNVKGEIDNDAIPLLLVHGWPGSFYEFAEVIPKLVNNPIKFDPTRPMSTINTKGNFHVVVPSLPGFAFSEAASEPGMSPRYIAELLHQLMISLGYRYYAIQGGDWGSIICRDIAHLHPESVAALHLNMPLAFPPMKATSINDYLFQAMALVDLKFGKYTLSPAEIKGFQKFGNYSSKGNGYFKQQSTKPHTLGWALDDSPIGLLSWLVEKFSSWTDCSGNLYNVLSKDEILTAVSIYWFTHSATSSTRIYYEHEQPNQKGEKSNLINYGYIEVPTGIANFPEEILALPLRWYKMCYNLKHHSQFEKGGHFAAWEQPDVFVKDIKKFLFDSTNWNENIELARQREIKKIQQADQLARNNGLDNSGFLGLSSSSIAGSALLLSPFIPTPIVLASGAYLLASKL